MKEKLSIIVNCYNEEETINIFYDTVKKILNQNKIRYEMIFINDNSIDNTLKVIKKLASSDSNVKYISTSRNFGKEAGIYAGYEHATGDFIVCMDVDLQDPPVLLPKMYKLLQSGEYDAVATYSVTRNGYSFLRKSFTKLYYSLLKKATYFNMREGIRDYRMVNRKVATEILNMKEYSRYSRYLFEYAGFKTYWIEFENPERVAGNTKWGGKKLLSTAIDGFLQSDKLLYIPLGLSILNFVLFIIFIISFIILLAVDKYNTILLASSIFTFTLTFISGLFTINNLYIARIFNQVLNRPIYIVGETNIKNIGEHDEK